MADTKVVKLRLMCDSYNLYHRNEDGIPIKKRGHKRVTKGQTFEVPDYEAERLLAFNMPSPMGNFVRRNAVVANSDEDPYRDNPEYTHVDLAPGVSARPEYDFGSTTVAGELIADPNGELAEQRQKARDAEVAAVAKPEGKANRTQSQPSGQSNQPVEKKN